MPEKLPIKVDRFSENIFLASLSRLRQQEINGSPIPKFLSAVAVAQNMREALSLGHAMHSAPQAVLEKFAWYFMGDWCLLIESMTAACKPVISMSVGHINATLGQSVRRVARLRSAMQSGKPLPEKGWALNHAVLSAGKCRGCGKLPASSSPPNN
jgi:hypothetical protein